MKAINRLVVLILVALGATAVREQVQRPPQERTWHGKVLNVPYDFRMPTLSRARERLWNPDEPSLFSPQVWGVGWTLNFYQLAQRLRRKGGDAEG